MTGKERDLHKLLPSTNNVEVPTKSCGKLPTAVWFSLIQRAPSVQKQCRPSNGLSRAARGWRWSTPMKYGGLSQTHMKNGNIIDLHRNNYVGTVWLFFGWSTKTWWECVKIPLKWSISHKKATSTSKRYETNWGRQFIPPINQLNIYVKNFNTHLNKIE